MSHIQEDPLNLDGKVIGSSFLTDIIEGNFGLKDIDVIMDQTETLQRANALAVRISEIVKKLLEAGSDYGKVNNYYIQEYLYLPDGTSERMIWIRVFKEGYAAIGYKKYMVLQFITPDFERIIEIGELGGLISITLTNTTKDGVINMGSKKESVISLAKRIELPNETINDLKLDTLFEI